MTLALLNRSSQQGGSSSKSHQALLLTTAVAAIPVSIFVIKKLLNSSNKENKDNDNNKDNFLPYPPEKPGGIFFFGNLFDPKPDFENGETYATRNLKRMIELGSDVFTVNIPWLLGKIIIIGDVEMAKYVLVTKNFPKPSLFYQPLSPLLGPKSLLTLQGQEWAGMRKAFNPGFAPNFLQNMVITMADKLQRFTTKIDMDIQLNVPTNMLLESQSFTSDVIVQIAFGEDWGNNTNERHPARILEDEICQLYSKLAKSYYRRVFDFVTKRKMNQVGIELDQEMRAILDRRLNNQQAGDGCAAIITEENAKDILSLGIAHLSKNKEDGSGSLTEEDKSTLVDQLKTFYFAGHDTTATTIAWAMWELSQNPDALSKLRSELEEHNVWTDKEIPPTYEQLQSCKYLEGVVKESLRMYPPASGVSRKCEDDYESYNGYRIGGAYLIVSTYSIQRHPDLWNRPDEFVPERFIDGSENDINSKFLPFSKGKRDCIGKYFALLEAKLAISALAMRYDLECDDPTDNIEMVLTSLPRRGAKVKFHDRA